MRSQVGLRLINSTSYAFTYVTGVATTGAKDTTTATLTSLPTEVYLSTTSGAAANGTKFTGCAVIVVLTVLPHLVLDALSARLCVGRHHIRAQTEQSLLCSQGHHIRDASCAYCYSATQVWNMKPCSLPC